MIFIIQFSTYSNTSWSKEIRPGCTADTWDFVQIQRNPAVVRHLHPSLWQHFKVVATFLLQHNFGAFFILTLFLLVTQLFRKPGIQQILNVFFFKIRLTLIIFTLRFGSYSAQGERWFWAMEKRQTVYLNCYMPSSSDSEASPSSSSTRNFLSSLSFSTSWFSLTFL